MFWHRIVSCLFLLALPAGAGLPPPEDISWTEQGGLRIAGWLEIEEDYGAGGAIENTVIRSDDRSIAYSNELVRIHKRWRLEEGSLIVDQEILPASEAGRRSELLLKIRSLRKFEQFYTPYAFSSPKISGRWIPAGEMARIECGYRGAYSNSMLYTLLYGGGHGVMFDRVLDNGYIVQEGGMRDALGDFSELTWPILSYGYFSWHRGHPGPEKGGNGWMENLYPEEGGSAQYRVHFFEGASPEAMGVQAGERYHTARKELAAGIYEDWERFHRFPKDRIGFYAFVGGPWGGGMDKAGNAFADRLAILRDILDENGMEDAYIYFWILLYDAHRAGWGEFPLDHGETHRFYAKLRDRIHHLRLGLYVNLWLCSTEAPVYKEHPEWFTWEYHKTDGGEDAYAGKLPEWGDFLAGEMPALIKAYNLDCVFFDGADWATRWRGTHAECRHFFQQLSDVMHENGAEFLANTDVPYVDIGMREHTAGKGDQTDLELSENFERMSFHEAMFGPEFTAWGDQYVKASGEAILKYYADKPQFIVRWPVHYGGDSHHRIAKEYFTPWVKQRAELLGRK